MLDTVVESEDKQIDIQPNTKIRFCFQGKYVSFDAYSSLLCSYTSEKKKNYQTFSYLRHTPQV